MGGNNMASARPDPYLFHVILVNILNYRYLTSAIRHQFSFLFYIDISLVTYFIFMYIYIVHTYQTTQLLRKNHTVTMITHKFTDY